MNEDTQEMGEILISNSLEYFGVSKKKIIKIKPSCWISCQGQTNFLSESLELPLPAEMVLQHNELVSPVGIDSDSFTVEDNVAHRSESRKSDS